jgi:hypothetical protein
MKRRAQFLHRSHIEGIEHLRPVHSHVRDGVFLFEKDIFEIHKINFIATTYTHEHGLFHDGHSPIRNSVILSEGGERISHSAQDDILVGVFSP